MELLDQTLELNFGVVVDGNVEVDFTQFAKIVDLLGGIDIELTSAEVANLYNDYGFSLHAGVNHLNGEQALAYARIRYIGLDFGRANRQRTVLTALVNQFRNASLTQLTNTLTGVLGMITTDMTDADILKYAAELAPILKDLQIISQTIPVEGSYYFGDVTDRNIVDCIFIDFEVNRKVLAETLGE
jgi:anionic cell wall polymer biosynthesis LytR-Cps2A-Psr (LCP) family protein